MLHDFAAYYAIPLVGFLALVLALAILIGGWRANKRDEAMREHYDKHVNRYRRDR